MQRVLGRHSRLDPLLVPCSMADVPREASLPCTCLSEPVTPSLSESGEQAGAQRAPVGAGDRSLSEALQAWVGQAAHQWVEGRRFGSPRQRFHLQLSQLMGWALCKVLQGVMWGWLDLNRGTGKWQINAPVPGDRAEGGPHLSPREEAGHLLGEFSRIPLLLAHKDGHIEAKGTESQKPPPRDTQTSSLCSTPVHKHIHTHKHQHTLTHAHTQACAHAV